jgi:hypothetical protein
LEADDPRRAIDHFLTGYFDWLADADELRRRRVNVHVWAEALADDRLAAVVAEGLAPASDAVRAIEEAVASGALPAHVDATALVEVILAMLQGFVLQAAWNPTVDPRRYAAVCTSLLDGYLRSDAVDCATVSRAQR